MRLALGTARYHRVRPITRVPRAVERGERATHKWWVAAIVILATIIVVMSFEALSLALPAMMTSMRVGLQEMSWTLTGYMISRTLFVGTAGWLGNRLGNRNLFALSLAVFTVAALLCGLAWSFEALVAFRILQGIGAGPLVPLIMVILHETFPPEQRGLAQSLYMVGDAVGSVLGRGLAGYLIEILGWRSVFYLNVPLGLAALIALMIVVPNRRKSQTQSFDPLGLLFLATFVVCLLVGLQSGAQNGWGDTRVSVLLLLAGLSLIAVVVTESFVPAPLIDLKLFRYRAFVLICLVSGLNIIGLVGAFLITPLMLQRLLGLSPIHTGLILIPAAIAWGVAGPMGGKLSDRFDARWILTASFVSSLWTLWLVASVTLQTPATTISWRVTLLFSTMALSFTPIVVIGMRTMPAESLRMGMGMMNLIRGLTMVVGVAAITIFLEYRQRYHVQLLSQGQSQHVQEVGPLLDRLDGLFLFQGDWSGLAAHKAMAVLSGRMHAEASMLAYQESYLGVGLLYVVLLVPVWLLHRRYTMPERAREGEVSITRDD